MGHRQRPADHVRPDSHPARLLQGQLPAKRSRGAGVRRAAPVDQHQRRRNIARHLSGRDRQQQGQQLRHARRGRGLRPLLAGVHAKNRDAPASCGRSILPHGDPKAPDRLRHHACDRGAERRSPRHRPRGLADRNELPDDRQRAALRDQLREPLVRRRRCLPPRAVSGTVRRHHRLALRRNGPVPPGKASRAGLVRRDGYL